MWRILAVVSLVCVSACAGRDDQTTATTNPPTQPTGDNTTGGGGGTTKPKPKPTGPTAPDPTGPEPTGPEPTGPEPTGPEPTGPEPTGPTGPSGTTVVRIIAANLTSGDGQAYDEGNGVNILQGLHGDVVLVQEFRYGDNSSASITSLANSMVGVGAYYIRETGYTLPNGVVSRYPIVEGGSWASPNAPNRGFAYARIDIPGPTDLWAVSVHLLTANEATRNNEAKTLLKDIQDNVPAGDFVVVGGDFNTNNRSEDALGTLSALFKTSSPYPVDNNGNGNTNAARAKPYDWVLSSTTFVAHEVPVVLPSHTFDHGVVIDTRVYKPLSDIAPAVFDDSGSTNMQHMAVVKDYLVGP